MPPALFHSHTAVKQPGDVPIHRQLQWLLFLRVLVLTLLLGISLLLQPKGQHLPVHALHYIGYFIAAVYLFTIISVFALKKTSNYQIFTYLQLVTDTFLVSFLVYFTGGSRSVFTIIYFFPIVVGGLMLYRTGGLIFATLSTLGYGAILFFEYLGYFPVFSGSKTSPLTSLIMVLHHFSVHGLIFFMVALLTIFLSERLRKTEAALSQTSLDFNRLQLLYKQIFDDITTGIITVDEAGKITSFNRASEEITGYSNAEVLDKKLNQLFPELSESQKGPFRQAGQLTRKNNKKIPIGFSWTKLNLPDSSEKSRVYTMQDLSQIKKMEDQVRQTEKMAAIGEMAAGVAHEFRNPLAAISGAAQMLGQDVEIQPQYQRLMNIIIRECDRLESTISEFLLFSKPMKPKKKWFSLNQLVDETLQLIRQNPRWKDTCEVVIAIDQQLDCWGDPDQIKQVFINLIDNAWAALEDQTGTVRIMANDSPAENGRENTIITIANSGPPISEDVVQKIFEPFFTTRENGTGLGLAIVWQIIKSHGGSIKVGSRADEGASFIITLPLP